MTLGKKSSFSHLPTPIACFELCVRVLHACKRFFAAYTAYTAYTMYM